jgi:beta-glucosidase
VISFNLMPRQLSVIDNSGKRVVLPGKLRIEVGGKQPGFTGTADATTTETLSTEIEVAGPAVPVE